MAIDLSVKFFRQDVEFVAGVAKINQFPRLFLPQVAFFGKSNVGKSSLINTICKRKAIARVSHTPGRTQQINFFSIAKKMLLADLPGYGFAKVSRTQRVYWEKLILHYLQNSDDLKLVNLLVDSRRGLKEHDVEVMNLLKYYDKHFQIVLTKADKSNVNEEYLAELREQLESLDCQCDVISTSSKKGLGAKELQFSILKALRG